MKSNDKGISIDPLLKIGVEIFWPDSAPLAVHSLCTNFLNFHLHITYYTFNSNIQYFLYLNITLQ